MLFKHHIFILIIVIVLQSFKMSANSTIPANNEGQQNNSDTMDQAIFLTSAFCYGIYMIDCCVVKLYRVVQEWELSVTDELKGNFISM